MVTSKKPSVSRKDRRENEASASRNERREIEASPSRNERRDKTQPARMIRRWIGPALECAVAVTSAALFLAWSGTIDVNPLDRIGQVSGLATLQFGFSGVGILLIGAIILAAWIDKGAALAMTCRIVCATVAGLSTGLIAGGLSVALHGTPSPLFVGLGDTGRIVEWASSLLSGGSTPKGYPPLAIHLLAKWAWLSGQPVAYAYKDFQLIGLALFGPMAYCAWRMLLPPLWAVGLPMRHTGAGAIGNIQGRNNGEKTGPHPYWMINSPSQLYIKNSKFFVI